MTSVASLGLHRKWGFWGAMLGAIGLLIVFYQIAAPMAEPKPSIGTQIGEIAGDMRRAAWDRFTGAEPAAPEPVESPFLAYLIFIGPAFGIVAIVLSLISAVRGEPWRFPAYALGLGSAAVLTQFFWLLALLILGTILLVAIIENIGDIFGGSWFGG